MLNGWYSTTKEVLALRKHMMRVDLRIYAGDPTQFSNQNDAMLQTKSMLTAAIIKGFDVIGIVAPSTPSLGWQARKISQESQMDIWVVPGEEYLCSDNVLLFVYLLQDSMPPKLRFDQAIAHAHKNNGFVMAANLSKRHAQQTTSAAGTVTAPDAVELFCAASGSYQDNKIDASYICFITSGSKSVNDIEKSSAFTLINRKELESLGLLPEGQGDNYIPPYLKNNQQIEQGADPNAVAENSATPPVAGTT